MWLNAATGPHLQELSLTIFNCHGCTDLVLPPSLFNSTNLVSLCLDGAIHMKVQESLVYFPSLKMLKINNVSLDSVVALLSRCPVLETFDINFFTQSLTNHVPPSSKSLKFTNDDFAWTYIEIDSHYPEGTTLGILDNLQSVVESYLDVFSPRESKFVDPILYLLRDEDIYGEREIHMRLCRSTSKVKLYC
ncbi:hypothetical protein TSUD_370250 [Trifolium subterraneum]|uniref:F-box/LRR-repeat protein 15/At3g58940/PEG3-like LRR domain-containing protein n=1 Tax=Trifolium subterraneum TaxID=3900 RepID=A0A2Z6P9G1_TRISU|nr:hypothetical protein TSUD_370250 [Trifolium subterraneum]